MSSESKGVTTPSIKGTKLGMGGMQQTPLLVVKEVETPPAEDDFFEHKAGKKRSLTDDAKKKFELP